MNQIETAIAALPPPVCREGLGANCPGPFESVDPATGKPISYQPPFSRVAGESRPGEIDVTVRCQYCLGCAHYTLDARTGALLDADALTRFRAAEGAPVAPPAPPPISAPLPPSVAAGLKMSPADDH